VKDHLKIDHGMSVISDSVMLIGRSPDSNAT
jgi:hypothetical protein